MFDDRFHAFVFLRCRLNVKSIEGCKKELFFLDGVEVRCRFAKIKLFFRTDTCADPPEKVSVIFKMRNSIPNE